MVATHSARAGVAGARTPLSLYNTLTRKKEPLRPLKAGKVTMYSCGPTVYDHAHIGNLRAYLVPDLLTRLLTAQGYQVTSTINFTDFGHLTDDADAGEDKIMKGMRNAGVPITLEAMREFTEPYIASFKHDMLRFGNRPPTTYTRASDYVEAQMALIKTLEEKGYAYQTSDGVYFDTGKFPTYGRLGNRSLQAGRTRARIDENPEKRNPADFALWKKGLLGWESAWGKGFPGWHIECTAMAFATLGKQIDIHTGGEDLQYTHHNGEIAQAEAATGKQFSQMWVHNAFVTIEDMKIAKSLGNTVSLRQLASRGITADTYRYWLLTSHYRSPVNFTFEGLTGARQALFRLKRYMFEEYGNRAGTVHEQYKARFFDALNDDLDTPQAIALIWTLIKDDAVQAPEKVATLRLFNRVLAIGLDDTRDTAMRTLNIVSDTDIPASVKTLLAQREKARKKNDYEHADHLREQINMKGFLIEDTPEGPKLIRAPHTNTP